MKKSSAIRLVLLGSASVLVAACGDDTLPQDAKFFSDVKECSAAYSEASCTDAATESAKVHASEAPRFSKKDECEAEFGAGNCETQSASSGVGGFFMPMMMGYMMGNMLGNNRMAQPVYRGPDNTAVMPKQGKLYNVGAFGGAGVGKTAAFRPATQIAEVSRGGLGNTASAYRSTAGS